MPNTITYDCPDCQRSLALPTALAPGKHLRCPHCQHIFTWPGKESITRTLAQAPPVTATLPPVSTGASPEVAVPKADTKQATLTGPGLGAV
jgi:uncharacterized paraquat-inducible protein A